MAHLHDAAAKDYYEILNISNPDTVNEFEIRQSYKHLSLLTHPDKVREDPNATARFQEISEAYETLRDPEKRRIYDDARNEANTAEANHARTKSYDPNVWFIWIFSRNQRPQSSNTGYKPHSARDQRANDRKQASEQWHREAQQADTMDKRDAMRAAQKATNERRARENADSQRRAEEEDLRARKNMEERARNMTKGKGKGKGKLKGKTRQNIFRNLPGSTCWHRVPWNKELGERACQACGRLMDSYVYRCPGCSMSACRKCMIVVKK
ncbi:DnaJ domain-containing protein [Xylaria flabelliformis]|nr:DnaJ domain-containing protein [Xylaria flabelliformis]